MRQLPVVLVLLLGLSACTAPDSPAADAPSRETTARDALSEAVDTDQSSPTPAEEPPEAHHPVSLPALMEQDYDGRGLRLETEVLRTASQVQYDVTYRSGDLRISGRLAVPTGDGPFPTIVLAHGYIDPDIYTIGRGMTRERAWLADHGYVVLHVDYRNHGASDDDPDADFELRLGYTEDVINAVLALRRWDGPVDDERMAVGGRSMGGGVVYNALVVRPGLVDAGVVWAPVSSDAVDNFEKWIRPNPERSGVARRIIEAYGDPARPRNAEFWDQVSPRTYFDEITEPVLIHHGTRDDTCPIGWSRQTHGAMQRAQVESTLAVYEGEGHAFGPQFLDSMERTERFLRRHLV